MKKIDTQLSISRTGAATTVVYTPSGFPAGAKIENAVMTLRVTSPTRPDSSATTVYSVRKIGGVQRKEILDFFVNAGGDGTLSFDVADELQDMLREGRTTVELSLDKTADLTIEATGAKVTVSYLADADASGERADFDALRAGAGAVDLFTGAMTFAHTDGSAEVNALSVGVAHSFRTRRAGKTCETVAHRGGEVNLPDYACGKGWQLNAEQYIVKDKSPDTLLPDGETSGEYTYIDGEGNRVEFREKYYTETDGVKRYFAPSHIDIDLDGKLTVTDGDVVREVKQEFVTDSGMTLSAETECFHGVELVDKDIEEVAALKSEIKELEKAIEDCRTNLELNAATVALLDGSKENQTSAASIQRSALQLELENVFFQQQQAIRQETLNDQSRAYRNTYLDKGITDNVQYLAKIQLNIAEDSITGSSEKFYTDQTHPNFGTTIEGYYTRLGNINVQQQAQLDASGDLSEAQDALQRRRLTEEEASLTAAAQKYTDLLQQKQHRLTVLLEQIPVLVLRVGDGSVMGFCRTKDERVFRLSVVADAYENAFYCNYLSDGKLDSLSTDEQTLYTFTYNQDGLLETLTDPHANKTRYEYTDGLLTRIVYSDGKSSTYAYDGGRLTAAISPSGYGVQLSYDGNQVVAVTQISSFTSLSAGARTAYTGQGVSIGGVVYQSGDGSTIEYYDYLSTTVKDKRTGKATTYVFDRLGRTATVYDNVFEDRANGLTGIVNVTSYERAGERKAFEIESLQYTQDLLEGGHFNDYPKIRVSEFELGDGVTCGDDVLPLTYEIEGVGNVYRLDGNPLGAAALRREVTEEMLDAVKTGTATDFVLGAWAKADSAQAFRRATDYCGDHCGEGLDGGEFETLKNAGADAVKQNRRFELRAVLTYRRANGETKTVEQYCSFDWMNTGWQYCAFPVTLSEDPTDELTGIEVLFDYSFNTGSASMTGMTLREGKWTYTEFNAEGQRVYSQTSASPYETTYRYNSGKDMIEETVTDKSGAQYSTIYRYDDRHALLWSRDWRGMMTENTYTKGICTSSVTYHRDDPSARLYHTESVTDEKGKTVGEKDAFGEQTDYVYDADGCRVTGMRSSDGTQTAYGYDSDTGELLSVTAEGSTNVTGYTDGVNTSVEHGGARVDYETDGFNRLTKVKIAGEPYSETAYSRTPYNEDKVTLSYANGEKIAKTYDLRGNVTKVELTDKLGATRTVREIQYNSYGSLIKDTDSGAGVEYKIFLDKFARETAKTYTQNYKDVRLTRDYDGRGNLTARGLSLDGAARRTGYEYDNTPDARLKAVLLPDGTTQSLIYDRLGRVQNISTQKDGHSLVKSYSYVQKGDRASALPSCERYGSNGSTNHSLRYRYDRKGNCTEVIADGVTAERYTFDALNRLTREDNVGFNKTVLYGYDESGNRTDRREYAYTRLDADQLIGGKLSVYGYAAEGWRDRLTELDGERISYDVLGNPTDYRGHALTWSHGRQLDVYGDITYAYNGDGIRTAKTLNGITTQYYLDGTQLLAQDNGNILYFNYGADGISGFTYAGVGDYTYRKNVRGDVLAIVDANGVEIARYTYDAWGNHKVYVMDNNEYIDIDGEKGYAVNNSNNKIIAELNPIRYRGYYYDAETGLYYLNSRYYDPETGRFLNADDVNVLDVMSSQLNGLNLYTYCLNNPIMMLDVTGKFPILIALILGAGFLIGAGIGGKVSYDKAVTAGKTGSELFWSTVGGVALGGAVGVAAAGLLMAGGAAIYAGAAYAFTGTVGVTIAGIAATKVVAIGLIVHNIFAAIIAPLLGITIELIEWANPAFKLFKQKKTLKFPTVLHAKFQSSRLLNIMNKEF